MYRIIINLVNFSLDTARYYNDIKSFSKAGKLNILCMSAQMTRNNYLIVEGKFFF